MADEKDLQMTRRVFDTFCAMLTHNEWHYAADNEDMQIELNYQGDDLLEKINISFDADSKIIIMYSPLPLKFPDDKLIDGAVATCIVNDEIKDGSFDYNFAEGILSFRLTSSFRDSIISEELLKYMLYASCFVVDMYNDKFFALSSGLVDLNGFLNLLKDNA